MGRVTPDRKNKNEKMGGGMALLIGISRGKYLQIGNYSLAFLGREQEDERRFLFRLSHPDEPTTDLAISKDDPVCLFGCLR